jgi:hypothetical protein
VRKTSQRAFLHWIIRSEFKLFLMCLSRSEYPESPSKTTGALLALTESLNRKSSIESTLNEVCALLVQY